METARKHCGLTMKAAAMQLGISESYYSMIERGERQQKLEIALAVKMSGVFDVSLEYIVTQEEMNTKTPPVKLRKAKLLAKPSRGRPTEGGAGERR